nr:uncharacterized protein LOC111506394 [Leptinotarsa decemlineata]
MYKPILLFGFLSIALAADVPATTPIPSIFNQGYYRNQLYSNRFNPYYNNFKGNKYYQPDYRYNQAGYFDKDYQKYNPGSYYNRDYYNRDYYNKNYYNNEYYQKYIHDARNAGILRFVNDVQPDGSYQYSFETQNGIAAEEQGAVRVAADHTAPVVAQGFYRYTSPEGVPVEVRYTADEFGYHPQGSVIAGPGRVFGYKSAADIPAAEKK